ncbi:MAG TPA: AsmA-like C-terminal region-containing protein, partial [Nitrospira sp.]
LPVTLDGSFGPLMETVELKGYDFTLGIGKMRLNMKGGLSGGQLDTTVSSPLIDSVDVPVHLPLTKPVQVKDLLIVAKAPYPLKQGVPAMELADISNLSLIVAMGNSLLHVKGTVLDGHAKVTVTSPSINTADVPVETGLKRPVELRNLLANADLKGREARLSNLTFQLFDGQVKAEGAVSTGSPAPPFNGKLTTQGLQVGSALQSLSPDSPLSLTGIAAADVAVSGHGFSTPDLTKTLEGSGHLEVKEGKIEGTNLIQEAVALLKITGISLDPAKTTVFSTVETDFLIKQGVVHVQKLLMDSHDFQATGGGTVGFDQTLNLAVNMALSPALSQKIAGSSPIGKLSLKGGRLTLPLLITGSVQRPSYGLDLRALTGKVQEKVEEKVKGTVKGLIEGTTKPQDLEKEGKELLKDLFGR